MAVRLVVVKVKAYTGPPNGLGVKSSTTFERIGDFNKTSFQLKKFAAFIADADMESLKLSLETAMINAIASFP